MRPALADDLRDLVLAVFEFVRERLIAVRLFQRVEIGALRGFGLRNSIGTRRWLRWRSSTAASSPTSPISAASPRPSRDRSSCAIAASFAMPAPSLFSVLGQRYAARSVRSR